jgi:hypothetical protein
MDASTSRRRLHRRGLVRQARLGRGQGPHAGLACGRQRAPGIRRVGDRRRRQRSGHQVIGHVEFLAAPKGAGDVVDDAAQAQSRPADDDIAF